MKRLILAALLLASVASARYPVWGVDTLYLYTFAGESTSTPRAKGDTWTAIPKWYLDSLWALITIGADTTAFHHADKNDSNDNLWADTITAHWYAGPVFHYDDTMDANDTLGSLYCYTLHAGYRGGSPPAQKGFHVDEQGRINARTLASVGHAWDFGSPLHGSIFTVWDTVTPWRFNFYKEGAEILDTTRKANGDSMLNPAYRAYMGYPYNDRNIFSVQGGNYGFVAQSETCQARLMADSSHLDAELVLLGSGSVAWDETTYATASGGLYTTGNVTADTVKADGSLLTGIPLWADLNDTTAALRQFVRDSGGGGTGSGDSSWLYAEAVLLQADNAYKADTLEADSEYVTRGEASAYQPNLTTGWGIEAHDDSAGNTRVSIERTDTDTAYLAIGGKAATATLADSAINLRNKAATAGTADTTAGGAARATLAANATNAYNADSLNHVAASGYALAVRCTTCTLDGWWKKPTGIKAILVEAIGGGGGGGGGCGNLAGTARTGGGGGGGGAYARRWFPADALSNDSTLIDIGAGGTAGTAGDSGVTIPGTLTSGGSGGAGDTTKFGATQATGLWSFGGGGGKGAVTATADGGGGGGGTAGPGAVGTTVGGAGGAPGASTLTAVGGQGATGGEGANTGGQAEYGGGGGAGATSTGTSSRTGGSSQYGAGGGAGGAGLTTANAEYAGAAGGAHGSYTTGGGGAGGAANGGAGTAGANGNGYTTCGNGGGSGGAQDSGTGGAGGAGGTAGGGGGGGGGGTPTGGVGAVGGRGEIRITYYF